MLERFIRRYVRVDVNHTAVRHGHSAGYEVVQRYGFLSVTIRKVGGGWGGKLAYGRQKDEGGVRINNTKTKEE
jgi:hypothetical protein